MRVLHLADVHLGYRAYSRVTQYGINQREADVFQTFERALELMRGLDPDLILLAGDLFHTVRPSNLVIHNTFRRLAKLVEATRCPIVMVAGNHESPRSSEVGCILRLFTNLPRVYVEDAKCQPLRIPEANATVYCVPHRGLESLGQVVMEPDPASKYNILMLHGTLDGIETGWYDTYVVPRRVVRSDGWDYVACGHYHKHVQVESRAYYSGSLEYTSPRFWAELDLPKGFVEYNLDERAKVRFHQVQSPRLFEHLGTIDASGLSAAEVNEAIAARLAKPKDGLKDKVVRLVVEAISPAAKADLDHKLIREARLQALHLDLDLITARRAEGRDGERREGDGQSRTLEHEWESFVEERSIPNGVDRARLREMGLSYLAQAQEELDAAETA